jgi:hypothetical protein
MYVGVPITVCVPVSSVIPTGVFEIPKSRILSSIEPSGRRVMKKFDGLISRWTMPIECASAMPSHACSIRSQTIEGDCGP